MPQPHRSDTSRPLERHPVLASEHSQSYRGGGRGGGDHGGSGGEVEGGGGGLGGLGDGGKDGGHWGGCGGEGGAKLQMHLYVDEHDAELLVYVLT